MSVLSLINIEPSQGNLQAAHARRRLLHFRKERGPIASTAFVFHQIVQGK
jgi:hypothetical protein